MFDRVGLIVVSKEVIDEETIMDAALEAGAEDVKDEGDSFEIITAMEDFIDVKEAIEAAEIPTVMAEITMIPQNMTEVAGKDAEKMMKMMDMLEDCDDVQNVHTNADIPDDMA